MAKKLTNNQNGVYSVGLDVGYGDTKAIMTGAEPVLFDSVWSYAREIKFNADELATKYPGDMLMDDEGEWFIGAFALKQAGNTPVMKLRGRTADESAIGNIARVRLAKAALGKLFPDRRNGEIVHIQLATGLPVDHMRGAAELRGALQQQHLIQTDNTHFVANITKVIIMPQPYGTIYRKMMTDKGELDPCHTAIKTGVVDIGTYTIDLALDDDGDYVDSMSGSAEAGVYTALDRIASYYERDFKKKPSDDAVKTILRTGCVRIRGDVQNLRDWQRDGINILSAATLNLMSRQWQNAVDIDAIYVSGGGAALTFGEIKSAYPQAQLVENAQFSNAQGYLNFALYDAKE